MFFKDLIDGFTAYLKAFRIISELRLWKYFFVPAMISIFLGGLLIFSTWGVAATLGTWLISWYPFEVGISFLSTVSSWLGGAILLTFGLIIYKHLVIVAVSPFMSPMAQKIEEHLTGHYTKNEGFNAAQSFRGFSRGLLVALRNIIRELFFIIPLFILSLIPILSVPCTILIFLIQGFYAGFGNMDYTLERHYNVGQSAAFAGKHRGLAIANGSVFLALLMTGIGFLFAPPLAAVAATVESVKRIDGVNQLTKLNQEFV